MRKSILPISVIMAAMLMLTVGCGDKNPAEHEDDFEVSFSYTPSPATVDSTITYTFVVESEGAHVEGLTGTEAEFEMGTMDPVEISLIEDATEPGHYVGSGTLPMAGDYEVHFHYVHEGEASHITMTNSCMVQ